MRIGKVNNAQLIIGQSVSAGQFVNIYVDGGVSKIRPADASLNYPADGYVLESGNLGSIASVFSLGINDKVSNAPVGPVYLSTNGGVSASPPAPGSTVVLQLLGPAIAANAIVFQPGPSILQPV
jgi:hypothetical protein